MLIHILLLTLVTFSSAQKSFAQNNPHEFSSPGCTSHGEWTQTAIAETANITNILGELLHNPDCKGLQDVVDNLSVHSRLMQTVPTPPNHTDKDNEVQVNDLKSMSEGIIDADGQPNVSTSNTFFSHLLGAAKNSSYQPALGSVLNSPTAALNGFTVMFKRSAYTAEQGMNVLSSIMKALPQYDTCLIGHPNEKMLLLSSLVKMTSALSASGSGANNAIGSALSGLSGMMRDRKFTAAMRQTNRQVFSNSVSCLLETVSEHWCEIDNAQRISNYFQKERNEEIKHNMPPSDSLKAESKRRGNLGRAAGNELIFSPENPLNGYYLLTRELPLIADWLQKVQTGTKPRLHTDATFQNEVLQKVTDLMKIAKTAQGQFREDIKVLNTLTDKKRQRNQLFTTVSKLVGMLGSSPGGGFADDAGFISNTVNASFLPFYLIGLDGVPKECTGAAAMQIPWMDWMQKNPAYNNDYVPAFNEPAALAQIIEKRLNDLLENAGVNASAYYRNFLIVDRVNLVNETSIGPFLTVRGTFQNIYLFLASLEHEFRNSGTSPITLASIVELKERIRRFNISFVKYENMAKQLDQEAIRIVKIVNPEERKKAKQEWQISRLMLDAADEVINSAYEEFNILYSKDGFLTTKLRTFIQMDLKNKIEASRKNEMDPTSKAILTQAQKNLLNYILKTISNDPALANLDLSQAKGAEESNLHTLASVFQDTLYFMILEKKSYVQNWTGEQLAQHLKRKLAEGSTGIRSKIMPWMAWTDGQSRHPDLYAELSYLYRGRHIDDEFHSNARVMALYCALSLSLYNRAFFMDICKGAVIPSFYREQEKELDLYYDAFLPNEETLKASFKKLFVDTMKERSGSIASMKQLLIQKGWDRDHLETIWKLNFPGAKQ